MKNNNYDAFMDKECIDLCNTLNSLKGVQTVESCCGHLKDPYMIFMCVKNFYSLAILGRVFDKRYSNGEWELKVITSDCGVKSFPTFELWLVREKIFISEEEMNEEIKIIIENINYWSKKRYKKYLQGKKIQNIYKVKKHRRFN